MRILWITRINAALSLATEIFCGTKSTVFECSILNSFNIQGILVSKILGSQRAWIRLQPAYFWIDSWQRAPSKLAQVAQDRHLRVFDFCMLFVV